MSDPKPEELVYLPRPVYVGAGAGKLAGALLSVGGLMQEVAGHQFQRLLGFWVCWHVFGGLNGMIETGLWSQSGTYEQLKQFKETYGCTPDELLPELALEIKRDAHEWPERYSPREHPNPAAKPYKRKALKR